MLGTFVQEARNMAILANRSCTIGIIKYNIGS